MQSNTQDAIRKTRYARRDTCLSADKAQDAIRNTKNALSFDVEEYFQVSNFQKAIKRKDWVKFESRVQIGIDKILDILDEKKTKATFFILGWIAERHPESIKEISRRKHEIALHGYDHKLIYQQNKKQFEEDIKKSIEIIQRITENRVMGFRAPSFSITNDSLWALEILAKNGIQYDASIFPITHPDYGIEGANRLPHTINNDGYSIREFPCSTIKVLGKNIPFSGGGYLRLLPYKIIQNCIRRINRDTNPVIVYMHPWELDPEQPRINAGILNNFRHYNNLKSTESKLRRLLDDFEFSTVKDVLSL